MNARRCKARPKPPGSYRETRNHKPRGAHRPSRIPQSELAARTERKGVMKAIKELQAAAMQRPWNGDRDQVVKTLQFTNGWRKGWALGLSVNL